MKRIDDERKDFLSVPELALAENVPRSFVMLGHSL